jgi:hypothetical protein
MQCPLARRVSPPSSGPPPVGPGPPPARSSSISESSEQLPSIAPRWPHSESRGPGCVTAWPAVRRRVALRNIAGVAFSSMLAVGWTCEIRVCIRVMRHGRLGAINWADRLAFLTLDACHVQTPLQNGKAGAQCDSHIGLPLQRPSLEITDPAQT